MESGYQNASLHSMNGQNRHELHRRPSSNNVKEQVRAYKRSNSASRRGLVSKMIDSAIGYELIGSIAAIAVLGSVFAVAIK